MYEKVQENINTVQYTYHVLISIFEPALNYQIDS
jgi:hypothetical protein